MNLLDAGASQVFLADKLAGGSTFCYFGPTQKSHFLSSTQAPDWDERIFFTGEHASFTDGWTEGAFEAALRCMQQIWDVAVAGAQG